MKAEPIVNKPTPYEAILKLDILSATGTAILIACIISIFILKMSAKDAVATFKETLNELKNANSIYWIRIRIRIYRKLFWSIFYISVSTCRNWRIIPVLLTILRMDWRILNRIRYVSERTVLELQAITAQQVGVSEVLLLQQIQRAV